MTPGKIYEVDFKYKSYLTFDVYCKEKYHAFPNKTSFICLKYSVNDRGWCEAKILTQDGIIGDMLYMKGSNLYRAIKRIKK